MYKVRNIALNPLQWVASPDGWIDPSLAPTLETRLQTIAEAGFTSIQSDIPVGMSAREFADTLGAFGITPGPGYLPVRLPEEQPDVDDASAATAEKARRLADAHAELGIPVAYLAMGMAKDAPRVAHPGVGYDHDQDRLERVRDLLAETAEIFTARGVRPAFHPHVGTWAETEADTRFVLGTVDDSILGFGPDIGHLAWAGADVTALLTDFGDRIAGVHVKNFRPEVIEQGRAEGWDYRATVRAGLWVEPGLGADTIQSVLSVLPDGWPGTVMIEVDRGAQSTPEESIALCGRWARDRLAELAVN